MKEIVTRTWCDLHVLQGEPRIEAAVLREVSLDGSVPRELDLCADCDAVLFDPIIKLLNGGRLPETVLANRTTTSKKKRNYPENTLRCPLCERAYSLPGSVVNHIWQEHANGKRPAQPTKCPDCEYEDQSGVGMAGHRRGRHGYDRLQEALDAAQANA